VEICCAADVSEETLKIFKEKYKVETVEELPMALSGREVVEDGQVITSRGAGTALAFGLALVRRLFGGAKAQEVSRAVML
jgi:4-methyl-5(b-hydroxyethyl)-thiazole monophosphate biosynthesis